MTKYIDQGAWKDLHLPQGYLRSLQAVQPEEELQQEEEEPGGCHHNQQLCQGVQVLVADVVLPLEEVPQHNHHRHHAGHAGVDRADNEVGGEDGAVPSLHRYGHAEVPGHNAVHRDEDGQNDGGEQYARYQLEASTASRCPSSQGPEWCTARAASRWSCPGPRLCPAPGLCTRTGCCWSGR